MDFDRALGVILDLEGGDKVITDRGGLTKWGISQRAYPGLDIRALTREQAAAIYRRDYWEPAHAGDLPGPLAVYVFDAAVNQGVDAAIRMLQDVAGCPVDGRWGPRTRAAVMSRGPAELALRFLVRRAVRYMGSRGADENLKGWLYRLFRLQELSR